MKKTTDSQTIIRDNKGGFIVKSMQRGKPKSNDNTTQDISNLVKMALKAHNKLQNPSQRYPSESSFTTDTSDSEDW